MIDVNSVIEEVKNKIQIDKDSIKVDITGALGGLEVTENGIYTPNDDIAGFNKVVVNVNTFRELFIHILSDYSESYDLNDDDWIYNDSLTEHKINSSAFRDDSNLRSIRFNKITGISESAFNGCTSLITVDLPACKAIDGINAFNRCTALTTVNLPVCEIIKGIYVFSQCTALTTLDLPACKEIAGYGMFSYCASLEKLILRNNKVVKLQNDDIFFETPNLYIYVPDDLVEDYKSAAYWSSYSDKIRPISQLEG